MIVSKALFVLLPLLSFAQGFRDEVAPPEEWELPQTPGLSTAQFEPSATFRSLAENLNDCGRFSDSGPDSGWYVGFNNAWIVKLPPVSTSRMNG